MTKKGSSLRAWLYVLIAFATALVEKDRLNDWHVWLGALVSAMIALRAYIDTSVTDEKKERVDL